MLITDDQIQQLCELRLDAAMHIDAASLHMERVETLAIAACDILQINTVTNQDVANIVKAVVKFGTNIDTLGERIRVAEANRKLYEAAEQDSQDEVTS